MKLAVPTTYEKAIADFIKQVTERHSRQETSPQKDLMTVAAEVALEREAAVFAIGRQSGLKEIPPQETGQ